MRLVFTKDALSIICTNNEQEEAEEGLAVEYAGDPLDIGFNAAYLLEILRYIPSDEVKLTFRAPERAATVEPEGWDDPVQYLCLVMPLRLMD